MLLSKLSSLWRYVLYKSYAAGGPVINSYVIKRMKYNSQLRGELHHRISELMLKVITPLNGKSQSDVPSDVRESIDKLTT